MTRLQQHIIVTYVLARLAVGDHLRQRFAAPERDRGEGPVFVAIMVALIALVAVGVAAAIKIVADGWTSKIPTGP